MVENILIATQSARLTAKSHHGLTPGSLSHGFRQCRTIAVNCRNFVSEHGLQNGLDHWPLKET